MYVYVGVFSQMINTSNHHHPHHHCDGAIVCKLSSGDQSLQQRLKFSISGAFHFSPIKVMICGLNTDWRLKECLLEVYKHEKDAFCCHLFFFQNIVALKQPNACISSILRERGDVPFIFYNGIFCQ